MVRFGTTRAKHEEFRYPLKQVPRTAVLAPWFGEAGSASSNGLTRIFSKGWCEEAARFAPQAIAATWDQARALDLNPALTHAVVILHREAGAALTDQNRDWLWRQFGVPVFEQVIGERGKLLAAECEAHQGMHVMPGTLILDLLDPEVEVDSSPCGCGLKTPRVRLLRAAAAEAR